MNWDERQKAKRIEARRMDRVGVPADHFVPLPQAPSRRRIRALRRQVRAAIAQRDAR